MRRRNNYKKPQETKPTHKINGDIKAREVRVVGENIEVGVYPIRKALQIAEEQELDLVEISPNAEPPVCKVIDYKKFLFEQKKKMKAIKANAQKVVIKEIRFGPQTDEHDYQFKLKHAQQFLKEGAKLKAYVMFKGRAIIHKEKGEIMLLRLIQELEELAKVDQLPKLEGKRMITLLSPKKAK